MTPEQIQQLIDYMRDMGELAVSKGFELAMRQVYASAITNFIWAIVTLIGLGVSIWALKQGITAVKDHSSWQYKSDAEFWGTIFGIFGIVIFGLLAGALITDAIKYLVNPEWYAIDLLFGLITGG